jgi:hypothetical protein
VPAYVRSELKKKTGIVLDEFGKRMEDESQQKMLEVSPNETLLSKNNTGILKKPKENKNDKYKPIQTYKPLGNLIYDEDLTNL